MRSLNGRMLSQIAFCPHTEGELLNTDKTIRRVRKPEQQEAETYRYWQSLPIGARLSAVWDVSAAAYAFAAAYNGARFNDAGRPQRAITRIQRSGS